MRPYPVQDIPRIIDICRPFSKAHGEPVGWGEEGARRLGITDVEGKNPDWGSSVTIKEGEVRGNPSAGGHGFSRSWQSRGEGL
jgi:uncharacterized protein YcsI (UPF0317 family)